MRHAAFFEALAEAQEGDSAWELATIGYFIIRCLDDWHMLGGAQLAADSGIERVREKIEALKPTEARYAHVFREALHVLMDIATTPATVIAPLLAYASLLETDSRWALAADVYDTIADTLSDSKLSDTTSTVTQGFARRREAFALRNIGEFDRAEVRYRQAIITSERVNDFSNIYLSQIGLANLARVKGNLPESLNQLDRLIKEWGKKSYPQTENAIAELLQTRGAVLHEMERYDEAIQNLFGAYRAYRDQEEKNKALTDLASCAMHTGYFDFAYDVLRLILHRTELPRLRQIALVNLIYLSVAQSDTVAFLRYRKQWTDTSDVVLDAMARLAIAMGMERFGNAEDALAAYTETAEFAERSRVAKIQFDALAHVERMRHSTRDNTSIPASATVPLSLWPVADALSHEYQLATTQSKN